MARRMKGLWLSNRPFFAGDSSLDLSKLVVDAITLVGSSCGNYPAGLRALSSGLIQVRELVD